MAPPPVAQPRRPSRSPLIVAALLVTAAALLLSLTERGRPARAEAQVEFPRSVREAERERIVARRTLPPLPDPSPAPAPRGAAPEKPQGRDPFLVALPADATKPLLVLEANALRHSRLGELFVDCVLRTTRTDPFEEVRREAGIDPLKDVDRVAFAGDGLVLSGFFERARLERLELDSSASRYGDAGRIFVPRTRPSEGGEEAAPAPCIGAWREQILVLGERRFVEGTIDRLEGRAPEAPPALPEHLTYGEAYGILPGDGLRALFRGEQSELGRRLAAVASRIELHADVMRDVAVVARVSGADASALEDLGTAFGAALAVARIQARVRGDDKGSELLEHARVVRDAQGGFSLELALPVDVLERWFAGCGAAARPQPPVE